MAYKNKSVIGTPVEHRRAGSVSRSGGTPLHHAVKAPWPPQSKAQEVKAATRAIDSKPKPNGVLERK
jgi:hypothetical protein